eukprot:jgi/Botrbrau1/19433/Bobra.0338s0056.1
MGRPGRALPRRQDPALHILMTALFLGTWLAFVHAVEANRYIEDTDHFPGWKGELPKEPSVPHALDQRPTGETVGYGEDGKELWRGEVIEVSKKPRAFVFKNFLSSDECDYLVGKARPMMVKSTVVDNETGKSVDSKVRTSTGTFFARQEDAVIERIEKRISLVTHLPEDHGEGLQVLHYQAGQQYEPHHDFFHDKYNARPENGGQRIATVLMYLTEAEEGGETVFPEAETKVHGEEWSECARKGLAVKTKKGDALLFYSLTPDGEVDHRSLHGSCPTTKGEKWSATKWLHVGRFGSSVQAAKSKWAGGCADLDELCIAWAKTGECEKNPAYMNANCRKSCKLCPPSAPGTETE